MAEGSEDQHFKQSLVKVSEEKDLRQYASKLLAKDSGFSSWKVFLATVNDATELDRLPQTLGMPRPAVTYFVQQMRALQPRDPPAAGGTGGHKTKKSAGPLRESKIEEHGFKVFTAQEWQGRDL